MTYQESYEKLGSALSYMSDRLRELLENVDENGVGGLAQTPYQRSWLEETDTTVKLKTFLSSLQQDKQEGNLQMNGEAAAVLKDIVALLQPEGFRGSSPPSSPKSTGSMRKPLIAPARSRSSFHQTSKDAKTIVLSSRACVVCHRDDRPGEQRKSGFKCHECIGVPHKEDAGISFAPREVTSTKSVDSSGQKFIDEYDMGDSVGKGAYGKVKTCTHKKSKQTYAMKIVDRRRLEKIRKPGSDSTEFDKVMMEIEIMKSLQHPNVVKMYEVIDDQDSGKVYLIMEYCERGRIFDLDKGQPGFARDQKERLKKYIVAIASGLEYLHNAKIYHRDLKPDNILVDANDHVKLTDFGVSTVAGENGVLNGTEGTPAFNAPEEFCDKSSVQGDKADIWSFGVTVYCIAFGYLPFSGQNLNEIGDAIRNKPEEYPEWTDGLLEDLLKGLLDKVPEKRMTLRSVLEHPYLEDVRTVKGQAVETITCRMKAVLASLVGFDTQDPEFRECEGVLVQIPQNGKVSKGVQALGTYINTKGGNYQVVLPTPDSCTLFKPRSSRHNTSRRTSLRSRDLSFSYCNNDQPDTNDPYRVSSILVAGSGSFGAPGTPTDPNGTPAVALTQPAFEDPYTEVSVRQPSVGATLLDELNLNFL